MCSLARAAQRNTDSMFAEEGLGERFGLDVKGRGNIIAPPLPGWGKRVEELSCTIHKLTLNRLVHCA
jgi:hypothetical protein